MNNLDLSKIHNVHFIGIGGIGVSAIARMMVQIGKNVTGQDMQGGEIVDELVKLGIDIKIGQSYENIPLDTDLIVYTIAIDTYDKELAKKIKEPFKNIGKIIPSLSYPQMLGLITKDKYTIAVCGTHGKTTTTGMVAEILNGVERKPSVIIGSLLAGNPNHSNGKATNYIHGDSDIFIVEACEYRRSFLNINPKVLVITNIDEDHLDYYKDIQDIRNAFHEMVMKVPKDGYIICNPDDINIKEVVNDANAKIINWQEFYNGKLKLKVPGIHNKKDAAAAIAAAGTFGISKKDGEKYVCNFPGTWRRFEYKGKLKNGVILYDDYAHHPTEIKATIEGFREIYPINDGWKIHIVFQPHLFSRTKLLLDDFAKSFNNVDEVLLLPIYYAREVDDGIISSQILSNEINKYSNNSKAFDNFDTLEVYLEAKLPNMGEKYIIVTMGAGEAFKIGDNILKI